MKEGWQARHPFPLGTIVYAKVGRSVPGLSGGAGHKVLMRGENERGSWVCLDGVSPYEFSCDDFTAVPPMPPVIEADDSIEEAA
jgi:hypothetical protein